MKIISYTYRFTLLYYLYTKKYDDFVILKLSFFFCFGKEHKMPRNIDINISLIIYK